MFVRSLGVQLLAVVVTAITGLLCTRLVHLLDCTLVWYANTWLILPVYISPMLVAAFSVHTYFARRIHQQVAIFSTQ